MEARSWTVRLWMLFVDSVGCQRLYLDACVRPPGRAYPPYPQSFRPLTHWPATYFPSPSTRLLKHGPLGSPWATLTEWEHRDALTHEELAALLDAEEDVGHRPLAQAIRDDGPVGLRGARKAFETFSGHKNPR